MKRSPARSGLRVMAGLLAMTVWASLVAAEEILQRPLADVPSFLGYAPNELVVVFKPATVA